MSRGPHVMPPSCPAPHSIISANSALPTYSRSFIHYSSHTGLLKYTRDLSLPKALHHLALWMYTWLLCSLFGVCSKHSQGSLIMTTPSSDLLYTSTFLGICYFLICHMSYSLIKFILQNYV